MTLLYIDGFNYASDDVPYRWETYQNNINVYGAADIVDADPVRYGSYYERREGARFVKMQNPGTTRSYIEKHFKISDIITVGMAIRYGGEEDIGNWLGVYHPQGGINIGNNDLFCNVSVIVGQDGSYEVYLEDTFLGKTDPDLVTIDVWHHLQVQVKCHNTEGFVIVRVNNVERFRLENIDTLYSGNAEIDRIRIQPQLTDSAYKNNWIYVSDLYILNGEGTKNNDFLGDCRVDCCRPNGAGTYTDFTPSTGNNWENVDEVDIDDDSTYNESVVVDDVDTYALGDITVTGASIFGIQQHSVVRKTDADDRRCKQVIKSDATEDLSIEYQLTDSFVCHTRILEDDPDTLTSWTEAGINALESGIVVTV